MLPSRFIDRLLRKMHPRVLRRTLPRVLRTTTFRLTALYVCVFIVSAVVLGVVVFTSVRAELWKQMRSRVESETALLQQDFQAGGVERLLATVQARGRGASALDYLVQELNAGALGGEIVPSPGLQPGWSVLSVIEDKDGDGQAERVSALVTDLGGGLTLAVGDELWRIDEVEEAIAAAFTGVVGLAAVLGIGGGLLLSRTFLARVDAISRTAEAIIGGDLAHRVPIRGTGDDLDRLAATLNRMLDRIGALMESLHQVGSDIAHDLRTPLSRLYQRLEDARLHARSVADYDEAVDGAVAEAEGLLATFAALLRIAQVEGASREAGFHAVDLSEVLDAVVDAYQPDAEAQDHSVETMIQPGLCVHGDRELLTQAIANLVENALRHTPGGTRICVHLQGPADGPIALIVEDNGPGVPATELLRLPDRFYRAERSRTTPGNGLGLTLAAAVADLHGGRLVLADAAPGLRAALLFPAGLAA